MKKIQSRSIDTRGLRQAVTTLAVAAAMAGWAVLARPDAATATTTAAVPAALVAVAQAPAAQAPATQAAAPAPRLRVVTAAPRPVTTTRSSR